MKNHKWILLILCIGLAQISSAQLSYYTMTSEGGAYGLGTIIQTDMDGLNPMVLYNFKTDYMGQNPFHITLLELEDGYLYGMTANGGKYSKGVLFRYHPELKRYKVLHSFNGEDGKSPYGSIIRGKDGMLYGMCFAGGAGDSGTIFRYNIEQQSFTKLYDLSTEGCAAPYNKLYQHSNGKIYGMTSKGGINDKGTLFEMDPITKSFVRLHDFTDATGRSPRGSVIGMGDLLYGMTTFGGKSNVGVVYSYDLNTQSYKALAHFNTANGALPLGGLTNMGNGQLYGLTRNGGKYGLGSLIKFDIAKNEISLLDDFSNTKGAQPIGDLVVKDDKTMIGLTSLGGIFSAGSLFEFDIEKAKIDILSYFSYRNGFKCFGSPTIAKNGRIYGVTLEGGFNNRGVCFEYNPVMDSILVAFNFNHATEGSNPNGSLFQASDGKLYGMTLYGGDPLSYGVVFKFDPKTFEYKKIANFDQSNGAFPYGSFVEGDNRILYALTWAGGSTESGTVIALDINNNQLTKAAEFSFQNGARPYGNLVRVPNGNFYGMTALGGEGMRGVIFKFDPALDTVEVQHTFHKKDKKGYVPYGSLITDNDNMLYGMTSQGGKNGKGAIFKFDYTSNEYTLLESFGGRISGANPWGSLLLKNNKLYGMNNLSGDFRSGVVFEFDLETDKYKKIFVFDKTNGAEPFGSLVMNDEGKLLGMATRGGANNVGVMFEVDPENRNKFNKLWDFDYKNGAIPVFGAPAYVDASITNVREINQSFQTLRISPNPSSDYIFINGLAHNNHIEQIDFYNAKGQLIKNVLGSSRNVAIQFLNSGLYFMHIHTDNGIRIGKFVVQ